MISSSSRTALRVALFYAVLIVAWGVFTHQFPAHPVLDAIRSPRYEELFDWTFAVLTGLLLYRILRSELLARVEASNRRTQDVLRMAYSQMELRVLERTAELGSANQMLRREVAERARMERDLSSLLDFSHEVAATHRLEPLLELVLDRLADLVGYTSAAIYHCQGTSLARVASRGDFLPELALDGARDLEEVRTTQGMTGLMAPIISAGPAAGGSAMLVPLVLHDQLVGVLRLSHDKPAYFSDRQARLAFIIANQAAVAIENAKLYDEAQRTAVLRERARLARELHDSIIQEVHGLVWKIHAAREFAERGSGPIVSLLDGAAAHAKASLSDLRAIIYELRPELLEELGLTGMLQQYTDILQVGHSARFTLELGSEPDVQLQLKEALYRIAREAMQNAVKHANANEITLRLEHDSNEVRLEIADDGIGFDSTSPHPGHLGLQNMKERALQFGGLVEILSEPHYGTRVLARVPCDDAAAIDGAAASYVAGWRIESIHQGA